MGCGKNFAIGERVLVIKEITNYNSQVLLSEYLNGENMARLT